MVFVPIYSGYACLYPQKALHIREVLYVALYNSL